MTGVNIIFPAPFTVEPEKAFRYLGAKGEKARAAFGDEL